MDNIEHYDPLYMTYDLETTIVEKYKRKASPFIKENWVVAEGWKIKGDKQASWRYMTEAESRGSFMQIPEHVEVLIGFNIKFDLLWELSRGNKDLEAFLKRGGRIWCCQYAEYLLRAQHPAWQMCSLNDTSVAYGGTPKIDMVKAMWNEGINTPDIPEDLLIDYLVGTPEEGRNGGDIGNTENIYLQQVAKAKKLGMYRMILDRMEGMLATTFCEFYGLHVNKEFARAYTIELTAKLKIADKELNTFVPVLPPELVFNWSSLIHKSCLIFGGTVKYQKSLPYKGDEGELVRKKACEQWPLFSKVATDPKELSFDEATGKWFKTHVTRTGNCQTDIDYEQEFQDSFLSGKRMGEPKFKKVEVEGPIRTRLTDQFFKFDGYTEPDPKWKGANTDGLGKHIYGVGKDIVEKLSLRKGVPFLAALTTFTALTKEIGTYLVVKDKKTGKLKGMLTCVDPASLLIHHKLNHNNTITTRLSSTDPNLQNLPRGDKSRIKEMFDSRFDDGDMLEADYSQLEVVVQGVLTRDPQLTEDLINKIDFHCKRVSLTKGISYEEALYRCKDEAYKQYQEWKAIRTGAKNFSFQRAYGAGAKAIAESTGLHIDVVNALIAMEIATYPMVEAYYADVQAEIEASAEPIRAQRDNGSWGVYRRGYYTSPTGTRYTWRSYDAPAFMQKRGVTESFAPPEIRNYPVQGLGGEFVQCVLGLLIRDLIKRDFYGGGMFDPSVVLCNTVHDCVWYDCKAGFSKRVWGDIQPIMESIPKYYNKNYGMNIEVPFPVDGEHGPHMNGLGHIK